MFYRGTSLIRNMFYRGTSLIRNMLYLDAGVAGALDSLLPVMRSVSE